MASHFKWYPSESEVVVPFNARYSFPSQANKAMKMTPRIPPKNGSEFAPGSVIRLEFPAQGYVNPGKTTLEFDVVMKYDVQDLDRSAVRFQNNIQSLFSRMRLLYGATPLEDIPNYNVIVRALTDWTGTNQQGSMDQTSINEGIGGCCVGTSGRQQFVPTPETDANQTYLAPSTLNVRQAYIQGIDMAVGQDEIGPLIGVDGMGVVPNATVPGYITAPSASHDFYTGKEPVRRYQVQLALGLFNQEKLIPTKFMASQLCIEITLENAANCMIVRSAGGSSTPPSYIVKNVNLIPEILEFDASYDESFLRGLQEGGVPIKFSTWNHYQFSNGASQSVNLQIQERSRSVKALFCMQRRATASQDYDNGAAFFNTDLTQTLQISTGTNNTASTFQEYQYRIGGR